MAIVGHGDAGDRIDGNGAPSARGHCQTGRDDADHAPERRP
ncbi:hypothetical protein SNL152K_8632 [Streptomyces sp. NL15-2K]|nr:hypothetical protein SNL152K_8632 [Streptomyces sp. NL15-2K]